MLIQHKHYLLPLSRIVHPLIYFVLGGYLLYRSSQYLSTEKPTRIFIFFFYFQKVILYISVTIGFLGFYSDSDFYSSISITVFSLIAVSMSSYILLNPDILIQITKSRFNSTKKELDKSKLTDVSDKMNRLMDQNKLFLDADYNLTRLSVDTDIPTTTIREIITTNGYKNFAAYINSFRIAHAEKLISNGYLDMYSIESLCNDSGFQAEVTFYRVFKRINGCTPKEYSYNLKKTNEQVESISI
jgi:AraC-like DNA-binding protein